MEKDKEAYESAKRYQRRACISVTCPPYNSGGIAIFKYKKQCRLSWESLEHNHAIFLLSYIIP